jgi:hypothetical protein
MGIRYFHGATTTTMRKAPGVYGIPRCSPWLHVSTRGSGCRRFPTWTSRELEVTRSGTHTRHHPHTGTSLSTRGTAPSPIAAPSLSSHALCPPPGDFRLCESSASAVLAGLDRTAPHPIPAHHASLSSLSSLSYNNRSNDALNCCSSPSPAAVAAGSTPPLSFSPVHRALPSLSSSSVFTTQRRHLISTARVMGAIKLDGTAIAKAIRERLGAEIAEKQRINPRYKPSLKIIQGIFAHF